MQGWAIFVTKRRIRRMSLLEHPDEEEWVILARRVQYRPWLGPRQHRVHRYLIPAPTLGASAKGPCSPSSAGNVTWAKEGVSMTSCEYVLMVENAAKK